MAEAIRTEGALTSAAGTMGVIKSRGQEQVWTGMARQPAHPDKPETEETMTMP